MDLEERVRESGRQRLARRITSYLESAREYEDAIAFLARTKPLTTPAIWSREFWHKETAYSIFGDQWRGAPYPWAGEFWTRDNFRRVRDGDYAHLTTIAARSAAYGFLFTKAGGWKDTNKTASKLLGREPQYGSIWNALFAGVCAGVGHIVVGTGMDAYETNTILPFVEAGARANIAWGVAMVFEGGLRMGRDLHRRSTGSEDVSYSRLAILSKAVLWKPLAIGVKHTGRAAIAGGRKIHLAVRKTQTSELAPPLERKVGEYIARSEPSHE